VLGIGAGISYRQHVQDAESRIQRNAARLYEHALKVFETFELSARYLDELLHRVSDDQLRVAEAQFMPICAPSPTPCRSCETSG
jgi:two-component system NtrC family sensor kinase